jgi:hypothetical protein
MNDHQLLVFGISIMVGWCAGPCLLVAIYAFVDWLADRRAAKWREAWLADYRKANGGRNPPWEE